MTVDIYLAEVLNSSNNGFVFVVFFSHVECLSAHFPSLPKVDTTELTVS